MEKKSKHKEEELYQRKERILLLSFERGTLQMNSNVQYIEKI